MECVCALAVVGIVSAVLLPLLSTSMASFKFSDSIRDTASTASSVNATKVTETKDETTLYVTIDYNNINASAESAFLFTKSSATGDYDVQVTYYDLKYGKEEKDAK